jgi:hypothetical protein
VRSRARDQKAGHETELPRPTDASLAEVWVTVKAMVKVMAMVEAIRFEKTQKAVGRRQ